jgi:hypothetical protein
MILTSLKSGLMQAWSTKRLLLVLYLASFLPALALALALRTVLLSFAGRSLAGAELVHGVPIDFLAELLTANRAAAPTLLMMLALGSVAFCLVSLFLSGGALAILARQERYRAAEFWQGAATFFGRFLRLTLWSALLLVVLSLLSLSLRLIQRLAFGPDPYEYISYWGTWLRLGVDLIALFFFRICFDYARIHAVLTDEKKMRRSLWRGLRFAVGNPIRVLGLAVSVFLLGGVMVAAYLTLSAALDGSTTVLVVAVIVAQQLYVLWGVAMRVTRYGSHIALYQNITSQRAVPVGEVMGQGA